ncbi:hypothetical protein CDD83_9417 [Cordyceps sp. RAO-2017]|nr:hypothetical protein CDD83_9417 [Cordyceps sp. RAO-2017]
MADMWVESLERKEICMRGWAENTSIDPSDTPENMAKFLAILTSALDPLHPGHGDTSVGLAPATSADAGKDGLTLRAHYARKREVDFLLRALGQKDSVIAKLSDKLEAMGTGLEYVFASLSGKKKVTRSAADGKVKGLAPFDQHDWRADAFRDMDGPDQLGDLLQDVFGDSGLRCRNLVDIDDSHVPDSWWRDLKDGHRAGLKQLMRMTMNFKFKLRRLA